MGDEIELNAAATPVAADILHTPVGALLVAATKDALCRLTFVDEEDCVARLTTLRSRTGATQGLQSSAVLRALQSQLDEYFAGTRREFDIPLIAPGSTFQESVWRALQAIPYGRTWSYLEVAVRVGDPLATRAVGMANNQNPVAILIPCHRVINADGQLGGYGGGLWRKRLLLDLELGQGRLAL